MTKSLDKTSENKDSLSTLNRLSGFEDQKEKAVDEKSQGLTSVATSVIKNGHLAKWIE